MQQRRLVTTTAAAVLLLLLLRPTATTEQQQLQIGLNISATRRVLRRARTPTLALLSAGRRQNDPPVIALTAASVTFDELKAKSFDGMLPKPFSPADLEEKLKLFL